MRPVWLLALAASGCRTILGIGDPPVLGDGGQAFVSCEDWHPHGFDPCALEITTAMPTFTDATYVYDTTMSGGTLYNANHEIVLSSDQMMQIDGATLAVLSIGRLEVPSAVTLQVIGSKPLLIVAWSSIIVDGKIDADSRLEITNPITHAAQTVRFGAGANQACLANAGENGAEAGEHGSAGGGGGGFQDKGGGGGASDARPGGSGGNAMAAVLHGGCPGGTSGAAGSIAVSPAGRGSQALGGAGGGAIRLVAHDSIDVRGEISANGAGGAGAPTNSGCGGGGGGSGGYLGFEAPIVRLGGSITANGGGGGGGTDTSGTGNDGANGAVGTQPAPGGAISGCGGAGGAGAPSTRLGGSNADNSVSCTGSNAGGGGGGGGGASGYIVVASPSYVPGTATLSPPAKLE